MAASLDQIVAATRRRVADAKRSVDLRRLEEQAEQHIPRGFRRALATKSRTGPAIIAELKKASPSRGLIRANFDPESPGWGNGDLRGAAALSVLTDEELFEDRLRTPGASATAKLLACGRTSSWTSFNCCKRGLAAPTRSCSLWRCSRKRS